MDVEEYLDKKYGEVALSIWSITAPLTKYLRQVDRELCDADTRCVTCYYSGDLTSYCGMGQPMHTGNCTNRVSRYR
jgi:hypothetical protein